MGAPGGRRVKQGLQERPLFGSEEGDSVWSRSQVAVNPLTLLTGAGLLPLDRAGLWLLCPGEEAGPS